MNRSAKKVLACVVAITVVYISGCASWLPHGNGGRSLPADAVVLGTRERITLTALPAQETHTYCVNGAVLQCERFGLKARCTCPAVLGR